MKEVATCDTWKTMERWKPLYDELEGACGEGKPTWKKTLMGAYYDCLGVGWRATAHTNNAQGSIYIHERWSSFINQRLRT